MEKGLKVLKVNFKYNIFPHTIICILMMIAAPLFMGTENLLENQVAKVAESYLAIFGIILIIPVFAPEMNKDIKDLIYSKKTPVFYLHVIRIIQSVIILALLCAVFLLYLKHGNCKFDFFKIFYTVMANSLFLGGIGMLIFALFDQIVFAYMIPIVYFGVNFGMGIDKLGKFYLFSMQMGKPDIKHWLIGFGVAAVVCGVLGREFLKRNN